MSRMTKLLLAAIAVLVFAAPFSYAAQPYTGNGGKGMSLAVLVPAAQGIAANQNYLPAMVQGVLVSDLTKYSAISVLDRLRLETVLKETESGIYKSEADFGRLGEIANVDYALTGSITKTGSGYAMQIQVVGTGKNTIGVTKAAYSGSCSIAELDNFTGIRKASLDLLAQMGVTLTAAARNELSGAASPTAVNSQTALAQGIVAQRQGNTIETMAKFYEAAAADPRLAEAAARANTVSRQISTGNKTTDLAKQVSNDVVWRGQWEKLLGDAVTFLRSQPFYVAKLEYDPTLRGQKANYKRGEVEFYINFKVTGVPYPPAYTKMIHDLNAGLRATGRNKVWELDYLVPHQIWESGGQKRLLTAPGGIAIEKARATLSIGLNSTLMNSRGQKAGEGEWGSTDRHKSNDSIEVIFGEASTEVIFLESASYAKLKNRIYFSVPVDRITDTMSFHFESHASSDTGKTNYRGPSYLWGRASPDIYRVQLQAVGGEIGTMPGSAEVSSDGRSFRTVKW